MVCLGFKPGTVGWLEQTHPMGQTELWRPPANKLVLRFGPIIALISLSLSLSLSLSRYWWALRLGLSMKLKLSNNFDCLKMILASRETTVTVLLDTFEYYSPSGIWKAWCLNTANCPLGHDISNCSRQIRLKPAYISRSIKYAAAS